jgi:hypothetical protein
VDVEVESNGICNPIFSIEETFAAGRDGTKSGLLQQVVYELSCL